MRQRQRRPLAHCSGSGDSAPAPPAPCRLRYRRQRPLVVAQRGAKQRARRNEIAPRVHNSGHWTIEGAITSQFENHIRAICGLPLGDTTLIAKGVEMRNIIGANQTGPKTGKWAAEDWDKILSDPANHLHLYGKAASRPGRKMGHVTRLTLA